MTLGQQDGEPTITGIALTTEVSASGLDDDELQKVADEARHGCIVSKALAGTEITLDARLTSG